MTILLDTNIILDALQERQPFDTAAKELLIRAQGGEFSCCFTANAATDIFYLFSKARDVDSARKALSFLFTKLNVLPISHADCIKALYLPISDFEDALVAVCAENQGVDYIVTRDEGFLSSQSAVPLITADELIEKLTAIT